MINKNIFFLWFGDNNLAANDMSNIEQASRINSNFNISVIRNLCNFDLDMRSEKYIEYCFKNKKWANLSNLLRLLVIYKYGGFYLDTDILCIKNFDNLCKYENLYGLECDKYINNAIFGGVKNSPFLKELIDKFLEVFDGSEKANVSSPLFITEQIKNRTDIMVFDQEFFYPLHWGEGKDKAINTNTYCIHNWSKRW